MDPTYPYVCKLREILLSFPSVTHMNDITNEMSAFWNVKCLLFVFVLFGELKYSLILPRLFEVPTQQNTIMAISLM